MASETYIDCPSCKQDWGMGLVYRDGKLAVECVDCGFRGPDIDRSVDIRDRDCLAIEAWRALPRRYEPINWTPEMRLAAMMPSRKRRA